MRSGSWQPLRGIAVVDAGTFISAPVAGLALQDLGASVTKVEAPDGDGYRRLGPKRADRGLLYSATNRGKRVVALDLATQSGRASLDTMLDRADVLLTNWRAGAAERLGLSPARVQARWPRLIWARISGFGQSGPLADHPAFDSVIQARSGLAATFAEEPRLVPSYIADKVTAALVAQAVLAALVERHRTDEGAVLDVAMLDAMAYFNGPDVTAGHLLADEEEPDVTGFLRVPRPVRTADGWIVVSPVGSRQVARALAAAGVADGIDRLRRQPDAIRASELFFDLLAGSLSARSTDEWLIAFANADVPASPILTPAQHLDDPQVLHNGTYRHQDDPELGALRAPRHPAVRAAR